VAHPICVAQKIAAQSFNDSIPLESSLGDGQERSHPSVKIAALIKAVPDTWSERHIDEATKRVDRESDLVIDEICEKAVEAALVVQEAIPDSTVTVVTMGPEDAIGAIRKALAMGAVDAIHIVGDELEGSDAIQTSAVLAAALVPEQFDLVVAGNESTDGRTAVVPAMLAERLGCSQLTFLRKLEVDGTTVSGQRDTAVGTLTLTATLPAVVSVTEQIGEARYTNLRGIMAAKSKDVRTLEASELNLAEGSLGASNAWTEVIEVTPRPPRTGGTVITDDGTAGQQIADYLTAERLI
jgi:electron transfer flavoprotein beta subunit